MSIKKELLTALTSILDPKTKKNIVEAGYISIGDLSEDTTSLTLNLNLPPEVAPYQSQLEALVKDNYCFDKIINMEWQLYEDIINENNILNQS